MADAGRRDSKSSRAAASDPQEPLRVGIWGSCVSRDTCEFMPDVVVEAYVARQSAIAALRPYSGPAVPFERLDSKFQQRMLTGDTKANAAERITDAQPDAVLIDLVDERRGVWEFPDGSYLTNSVEAFRTGVEKWGPEGGARLLEFGTDEHFELWKQGFEEVLRSLQESDAPLVLLDIAWAEVLDGQALSRGTRSFLGLRGRRLQRGYRAMARSLVRGEALMDAVGELVSPEPTRAEELMALSRRENARYRRYVAAARDFASVTVHRTVEDVRMNSEHKWGVGPYHYRDVDYVGIAEDIRKGLRSLGLSDPGSGDERATAFRTDEIE